MATKFAKQFSQGNKELYASRGEAVAKQMVNASEQIKLELSNKKFKLEMEIAEMMDFGKTHTTTLDVKNPESYGTFIKNLMDKKKELALIEIDIDIHQDTHEEWFTEIEVKKTTRTTSKKAGGEDASKVD